MALIKLGDGEIVNANQIAKATRCGNYTDVLGVDGRLRQIWDEDERVWNQISAAVGAK